MTATVGLQKVVLSGPQLQDQSPHSSHESLEKEMIPTVQTAHIYSQSSPPPDPEGIRRSEGVAHLLGNTIRLVPPHRRPYTRSSASTWGAPLSDRRNQKRINRYFLRIVFLCVHSDSYRPLC